MPQPRWPVDRGTELPRERKLLRPLVATPPLLQVVERLLTEQEHEKHHEKTPERQSVRVQVEPVELRERELRPLLERVHR